MAVMNNEALHSLTTRINQLGVEYGTKVKQEADDLLRDFNTYWVGTSAQNLANEVSQCLNELSQAITREFEIIDEGIRTSVQNHNLRHGGISYSGISFPLYTYELKLNETLAGGGTGADKPENIQRLSNPIAQLKTDISSILDELYKGVSSTYAFDETEKQGLVSGISKAQKKCLDGIDELLKSFNTRLDSEQEAEKKLESTNVSNLGG